VVASNGIGLTIGDGNKNDHFFELNLMFGLPILTCAIRLIAFLTVYNYETPKYLIKTGRKRKAK